MVKNIYVVAPASSTSGGPESLHQLVGNLKLLGYKAYIYYIDNPDAKVAQKFKKYDINSVVDIEDDEKNCLIVPEVYINFLDEFRHIKKAVWWLSLDFYLLKRPMYRTFDALKRHGLPRIMFPFMWLWLYFRKQFDFGTFKIEKRGKQIVHLYNCEYIYEYLLKNDIPPQNMSYLCGPISDAYFEKEVDISLKENIVLFNPKKGYGYTKKVVKLLQKSRNDVRIIPIENMSTKQIVKNMEKAKVYMDFGYFPGPERIPREAVMMKCNIITSRDGSAANAKDVLIAYQYKFKPTSLNLKKIVSAINELVDGYESHYKEFEAYRKKVIGQKEQFTENVKQAMEKIEKKY